MGASHAAGMTSADALLFGQNRSDCSRIMTDGDGEGVSRRAMLSPFIDLGAKLMFVRDNSSYREQNAPAIRRLRYPSDLPRSLR